MHKKRIARVLMVVVVVVLGIVLLNAVAPTLLDALLAMHGIQ